jgi:twinkle protein
VWRPEGIVGIQDVRERALATPTVGRPYPWPAVTKATFGRTAGQVIALGAGSGVGKTDVFTQMIEFDVTQLNLNVGVIYLEQPVTETVKRIAGKHAGKRFHVPDGSWTQDELVAAIDKIAEGNRLHFVDAFGTTEWSMVRSYIRYLARSLGVDHVYLDHLTALAAAEDDERKALEKIMAELAGDAKELGVVIHFVSHLATPEGKPHEEGGRVMAKHFKGSRAIIYWSHFMFGLERDTQAEDPAERSRMTLRCLKDRTTGQANGQTWELTYDAATGLLHMADGFASAPKTPPRRQGDF